MTKINLIFNENRNIQKEQSRLERMGLKDELTIVSDEHLLASARPEQMYYDSQRKCGCFWSGVLDNEEELRRIWEQYRPQSTGSSAAAMAAYRLGLTESRINVNQPGGIIQIDIKEDDTIYMTGSVGYVADMSVAESFFS